MRLCARARLHHRACAFLCLQFGGEYHNIVFLFVECVCVCTCGLMCARENVCVFILGFGRVVRFLSRVRRAKEEVVCFLRVATAPISV